MNAIPSKMLAELVVGYHDAQKAEAIAEEIIQKAKKKYMETINNTSDKNLFSILDFPFLYTVTSTHLDNALTTDAPTP